MGELVVNPPPVRVQETATTESGSVLVVQNTGPTGPQGPEGPMGPTGPAGGQPYVHSQSSAAATWSITHDLGRIPQVTVLNDSNQVVIADIAHASENALSIVFASPQTGSAHLI